METLNKCILNYSNLGLLPPQGFGGHGRRSEKKRIWQGGGPRRKRKRMGGGGIGMSEMKI
jgi:hypothetical protein